MFSDETSPLERISDEFVRDQPEKCSQKSDGYAREVPGTLQTADWDDIRSWYESFVRGHRRECAVSGHALPEGFVAINCNRRKVEPLRYSSEYVALSYVWGSSAATQYRTNLWATKLEKVVEDALLCATSLGIEYVWTDRYCIDQSSKSSSHLIQAMDDIYWNAAITAIDAAGNDAEHGLTGVSAVSRQQTITATIFGKRFVRIPNPQHAIACSTWATRGWTYQEGLLSRRRLVFTSTPVYFQCLSGYCDEALQGGFVTEPRRFAHGDSPFPPAPFRRECMDYSVAQACTDFSKRRLTYEEDALNALLGMFSRLWVADGPSYHFCGLPFETKSNSALVCSLLLPFGKPDGRRAPRPSWSWIAWKNRRFVSWQNCR